MKVFAWNATGEKDTVMTPYDFYQVSSPDEQTAFYGNGSITGEVRAWVWRYQF